MRRITKYFIPVIISGIMISCGTGKTENQTKTSQKEYTFLTDFKIIAYSGPPQEEATLERYQEIADAGIEYLVPGNGALDKETNLKALDLGLKTGIKIIPVDIRVMPFMVEQVVTVDTAAIRAIVEDYKDHPALAAYVVRDEPSGVLFQSLHDICEAFRTVDPYHEPLINLLPSYASPFQLASDDYRTHISSFIDIVKPKLLSYDFYALREGFTRYEAWFNDLSIVREETRKADIPFIIFIQSQAIDKGLRVPNRADILWQINTSLAYGTRGVGWFSYWTPLPDQGFVRDENDKPFLVEAHLNAMIDIDGNRTNVYDYVKEANFYLKKVGKGLLEWDNTEVARYSSGELREGNSPMATPAGEEANIVIGTYRMDKLARLVISNSSCEQETEFSLEISPEWKIDGVFSSIDAVSTEKSLTEWTLNPGGSVVINLKN